MANESRKSMYTAPWYGMLPGVLIVVTVLALDALADLVRKGRRV